MAATGKSEDKPLSEQELRFAYEYLLDFNIKRAALAAGYSDNVAEKKASSWLVVGGENTKPHLIAFINEKKKERIKKIEKKYERSGEEVIKRLWEITDRTMQAKPVMVFDKEDKTYVQATQVVQDEETGNLEEVGIWTFDSKGANTSLGLLGKHYGVIREKVDVDITNHDESVKRIRAKIAAAKRNSNGK